MTEYLTEQEQVEQLKKWLKQYGPTIIASIIFVFIIMSIWNYWKSYRTRTLTHSSAVYDEMLTLRAQNNSAATVVQARKLMSHYPNTPYSKMAALMLGRDAVLKKDYPEAINQLNWVVDHSKNAALREIAKLRIARIFIAEKKSTAALDLLAKVDDRTFKGLIDEIKGDAYLALQNTTEAKKAYQAALQELPNAELLRPILQIKLDNLATANDDASP